MKALIIILAIVAVSFIGLIVYGESRGDQPTTAKKGECETYPKGFTADKEPDEDQLKDWCPPKVAEATKGLQARFAPGLKLKHPATLTSSSSAFSPATFVVPANENKKMRSARIELVDGTAAILGDGHDAKLCLCKAGVPMNPLLFDGGNCPDRWKSDHLEKAKPDQQRVCQSEDVRGVLPFGPDGGSIQLAQQPPATVRIK